MPTPARGTVIQIYFFDPKNHELWDTERERRSRLRRMRSSRVALQVRATFIFEQQKESNRATSPDTIQV
jgi:hypothetical protein